MNLSQLLTQRGALLQQANLANLAFAYSQVTKFAARIARARLSGEVTLRHAAPELERYCATLTTVKGCQSVIEEHFTDEDVLDLADVIAFLSGQNRLDLTFPIQDLAARFAAPLAIELQRLGVTLDSHPTLERPADDGSAKPDCRQIEEKS
jgi:hypothetical protein